MFLQLPPTLPLTAADTAIVEIFAECEKGSRDCFPEDRVGIAVETASTTVLNLRTLRTEAVVAPSFPKAQA